MFTELNTFPLPAVSELTYNKASSNLPWIQVAPDAPYFITEEGKSWTPIGQNDAITWPDLAGFYKRKNLPDAEQYIAYIASQGVTCMRLMMEYCQVENRYLEKPTGSFQPYMVRLWDDLLSCCEKYGIRVLLTPFDTFWMRKRWQKHPYNHQNGGPCTSKSQWLCCPDTLKTVKDRMSFVIERWGNRGVIFAWDLWNEPDPLHAGNSVENIDFFIQQLSNHIRNLEMKLYGRTHLQTVSGYWPHLLKQPQMTDIIFRHPALDFATIHFYGHSALDKPTDPYLSAIRMGELINKALLAIPGNRPFFDSEHGPIHSYRQKKGKLPVTFDEQYFRYTQWAHMASGGAGGGLRWPYRNPHQLTKGMRRAQKSLASFTQLVDWLSFPRKNIAGQIKTNTKGCRVFACGTNQQIIAWLAVKEAIFTSEQNLPISLQIPGMRPGKYKITLWDTLAGQIQHCVMYVATPAKELKISFHLTKPDVAILIKRMEED